MRLEFEVWPPDAVARCAAAARAKAGSGETLDAAAVGELEAVARAEYTEWEEVEARVFVEHVLRVAGLGVGAGAESSLPSIASTDILRDGADTPDVRVRVLPDDEYIDWSIPPRDVLVIGLGRDYGYVSCYPSGNAFRRDPSRFSIRSATGSWAVRGRVGVESLRLRFRKGMLMTGERSFRATQMPGGGRFLVFPVIGGDSVPAVGSGCVPMLLTFSPRGLLAHELLADHHGWEYRLTTDAGVSAAPAPVTWEEVPGDVAAHARLRITSPEREWTGLRSGRTAVIVGSETSAGSRYSIVKSLTAMIPLSVVADFQAAFSLQPFTAAARPATTLDASASPDHERPVAPSEPPFRPFWIRAPEERDVQDESGHPIFRIGPTGWALVIEDQGEAYVIRDADGRIGVLHDTSGVVRS